VLSDVSDIARLWNELILLCVVLFCKFNLRKQSRFGQADDEHRV
jgi:hypothetical protein